MAIESTVKVSDNKELEAYLKVNHLTSFKEDDVIKISYSIESYFEKDGLLFNLAHNQIANYNGGDIWLEAYEDLKLKYPNHKNV